MKKVSRRMGCGDGCCKALKVVLDDYVDAGKQTYLARDLVNEAIGYVQKHDLVTVPLLAAEAWRMFMMTPERQKVNPFFTGGRNITVSYPTDTMDHGRQTGHHLQWYTIKRYRPYRGLFQTLFWTEG